MKSKENITEEVNQILIRNELNNYNMSCYFKENDLFTQMRNDIRLLCKYIKANKEK